MSLDVQLKNVLQCLQQNGLSAARFVSAVLDSRDAVHADVQESLTMHAAEICARLYKHENSRSSTFAWVTATMREELCKEVAELSLEKHGLHFKAASATVEQLETTFMSQLAAKMQNISPNLWELVIALLDSRQNRRRQMPIPNGHEPVPEQTFGQDEMDLGDLGGDEPDLGDDEEEEDNGVSADSERPKKRQRRAAQRNVVLRTIVS